MKCAWLMLHMKISRDYTRVKNETVLCVPLFVTKKKWPMLCKWNTGSSDSCCFEGEKI